ncbi:hypothetical protein [Vulcanisaeta souniana]|uniref:hypothetical protein n=1 Tax=Vulcanisaeta souniana TaxID=164452 RepID=UPI001FB50B7D|nr:hypothetical protein [Vulcanisaeta souniana]
MNGGIVNTHQWGGTYGSYLTMNLAHSWAILGDRERVNRYLTWIVNHASPTYAGPREYQ